jgi:hypothetical protein
MPAPLEIFLIVPPDWTLGENTAYFGIIDPTWTAGLSDYLGCRGSRAKKTGTVLREVGNEFFYRHYLKNDGESAMRRLNRRLAWIHDGTAELFSFVARVDAPHFRDAERDDASASVVGGDEEVGAGELKDQPLMVSLAAKAPNEGEASGVRSESEERERSKQKKPCNAMVATLQRLVRRDDLNAVDRDIQHIDTQLGRIKKASAGGFIGKLEVNSIDGLFAVQPTLDVLDKLGAEVWSPRYVWRRDEDAHALIVVLGTLGPGRSVSWRSRNGQVKLMLPACAARSSPQSNTGPYLIAITIVRGERPGEWRVGRAGAIAISSRTVCLPVDSKYERRVALAIIQFLRRCSSRASVRKPLPGDAIHIGGRVVLPDFIVRIGELTIFIEVLGSKKKKYRRDKEADAKALRKLGKVCLLDVPELKKERGGWRRAIRELTNVFERCARVAA